MCARAAGHGASSKPSLLSIGGRRIHHCVVQPVLFSSSLDNGRLGTHQYPWAIDAPI